MIDDERSTNLEQAQARANQSLRVFNQFVVRELDQECWITIEVNGIAVARVQCLDSALAELAAGWVFMHRYSEHPREFHRATAEQDRASVMIVGGVDIEQIRAGWLGEATLHLPVPTPWARTDAWSIPEDVLLDILREAWQLFGNDRLAEGSVHAALATSSGIDVVAFDITSENAVAKAIGWILREGKVGGHEILIVNGAVTRAMVDAACRVGILIIATPHAPTADAFRAARVAGISIVGYMRNRVAGLFADAGLVTWDEES